MGAALGAMSLSSMCGEAACCFGPAAVACCCSRTACTNATSTRLMYALVLLAMSIAAWVMLAPQVEHDIATMSKYTGTLHNKTLWGPLGVFRVMFASTAFFTLFSLVMIGVKSSADGRAGIQNGFWGIKFLMLLGLAVAAFFIPNTFFLKVWGWFGLIGGFFFLLIQMILLVDFSHAWSESWMAKVQDEDSKCHKWGLILASSGMYLASLVGTVLMYVFYTEAPGSDCSLQKFVISFNMIMAVVTTAVSLRGDVEGGILQSGVITFYTTYLTWSALSEADSPCMPSNFQQESGLDITIAAVLTFAAVAYSSLRTTAASQIGKAGMEAGKDKEKQPLLDDGAYEDDVEAGSPTVDNEKDEVLYNWSQFHLTFALASLYIMMVLTDWMVIHDGHSAGLMIGRGDASLWVKVVSGWVCVLLYIWTLVAPICLPDRDFS